MSSDKTARRKPATTTFAIVAAWLVILGLMLAFGWFVTHPAGAAIDNWDDEVAKDIAAGRTPSLDPWAEIGTMMGETIVTLVISPIVAIGLWIWRRSIVPALFVALAVCGVGGFYFFGTELIPRDRPPVELLDSGLVPNASFPSGHVGTATTLVGVIFIVVWTYARPARWWVLPLALVPPFVMWARLYEGAHHVSDALTSIVYSVVWLAALAVLVLRDRAGETSRSPSRSSSHAATSAS
jgi:membrane-associated phospholipid phosphatase